VRKIINSTVAVALLGTAAGFAQQKPSIDPARVDAAVRAAFPTAPADWQPRLAASDTMKDCSTFRNNPPTVVAEAIQGREKATIEYPADGQFLGDWKKGEAIAQSGYGLRFSDYPPRNPNGGNCYACHQITKKEVSYGTLGPSLLGYGKLREFKEDAIKVTYEKIYNSHAALACSNMPRFGANKVLTIEQIKDTVALLLSPDSPTNQEQ
jgi:L-cysteine S-thiosulfotransferase